MALDTPRTQIPFERLTSSTCHEDSCSTLEGEDGTIFTLPTMWLESPDGSIQ